jgi:hypothetical protein
LVADTKEEIMEYIHRYVTPLYEVAIKKLKSTGENFFSWEENDS